MPVRDLLMSASGASTTPTYVDDVFSTYLYTGTGATQSINNGIDLTKGGMTWIKDRTNAYNNNLFDTVRGTTKAIGSNLTTAQVTDANSLTAFSSTGFTLGSGNTSGTQVNTSTDAFASWTFRKAPKFFDIVQYTGTGSNQTINHSLGSTPGCIIVKETSATNNWAVYHKGLNGGTTPEQYYAVLNTTDAQVASSAWWNNTAPTSTQFTVGTNATVNASGQTYIAYIFANQAGGFGATGTDSAIACGNFTTTSGSTFSVNLGWEPQYVMFKRADGTSDWQIADVMRGFSQTGLQLLYADTSGAEANGGNNPSYMLPTATGFQTGVAGIFAGSANYIYIAIRRPDKPPTTGTSVFSPVFASTPTSPYTVTTGFPVDLSINGWTNIGSGSNFSATSRLVGSTSTATRYIATSGTSGENLTSGYGFAYDSNTSITDNGFWAGNGINDIYWNFKRSPTFFDEVCYTGTGSATTQTHNLTVVPEMIIVKERSASNAWWIYHSTTGNTKYSVLNTNATPVTSSTAWNNTTPTSSVFSIGTGAPVNASAATYVAYLFATCAGVSKVGSYTGNATGQSIACGFGSGGARFILIKRTDSTGDWYCFDSANGLTSSSSPYLTWDTGDAQTTGNNGVYASSGGFTLGATALLTTNIATASYIFLAIS